MQGFKTALRHKKISKGSQSEPFEIFFGFKKQFRHLYQGKSKPKRVRWRAAALFWVLCHNKTGDSYT